MCDIHIHILPPPPLPTTHSLPLPLSLPTNGHTTLYQPTEFEMRRRNEKFAKDVREGKKATHSSRAEKLAQRSPISAWALGIVILCAVGGLDILENVHPLYAGVAEAGIW
ncbi:hypothetical protein NMY22_g18638 [Coprinellus aureogranulatus]|nr:hypothetical protein NMY22_g18638 [Coprinellus aureogranulatus]